MCPFAPVAAQLSINVTTEKTDYHYRELVRVRGNVTSDGSPIGEGLVAIQIQDPGSKTIALRTVEANATPSENWAVEIVSFISIDNLGNPESIFEKEGFAYFKAHIRNSDDFSSRTVLLTITLFDGDSTPFMFQWMRTTIEPQESLEEIVGLYVDDWVSVGEAAAYVSVYEDWPSLGGCAYCPGESVVFYVTSATQAEPMFHVSSTTQKMLDFSCSSFEMEVRLPPQAPLGRYTITCSVLSDSARSSGTTAFNREHNLPGDIIFDRKIDIFDAVTIAAAYGTQGGEPWWNPMADLNADAFIDIFDIVIAAANYGTSY
jgi:hypothetical protein